MFVECCTRGWIVATSCPLARFSLHNKFGRPVGKTAAPPQACCGLRNGPLAQHLGPFGPGGEESTAEATRIARMRSQRLGCKLEMVLATVRRALELEWGVELTKGFFQNVPASESNLIGQLAFTIIGGAARCERRGRALPQKSN